MGTVVLDTSVLIAVLDPYDAHHQNAVHILRHARASGDRVVLPVSALAEALVGASRLGAGAAATTETFIDRVVDVVQDIDRGIARSAAGYRARNRSLRLPDAFILAAGEVLNASQVLTADARWSSIDPRVQVI